MPHSMKKLFKFVVLAVVAVGICSCNDEYLSTPVIKIYNDVLVTHMDGSRDTTYYGDTLRVGDTALVMSSFHGVSHPLVYAKIESDPAALTCSFVCDSAFIKEFLEPDSRPEEGYMHFRQEAYVSTLWAVHRYVAKSTGEYTVTFSAESMAKEPYSHNSLEFKQVIR